MADRGQILSISAFYSVHENAKTIHIKKGKW